MQSIRCRHQENRFGAEEKAILSQSERKNTKEHASSDKDVRLSSHLCIVADLCNHRTDEIYILFDRLASVHMFLRVLAPAVFTVVHELVGFFILGQLQAAEELADIATLFLFEGAEHVLHTRKRGMLQLFVSKGGICPFGVFQARLVEGRRVLIRAANLGAGALGVRGLEGVSLGGRGWLLEARQVGTRRDCVRRTLRLGLRAVFHRKRTKMGESGDSEVSREQNQQFDSRSACACQAHGTGIRENENWDCWRVWAR